MRTKPIMMIVALAGALGLSASEARAAAGPSVEEIEKAGSAAEHEAIAEEYAQEAARLRGEVAKHQQMLAQLVKMLCDFGIAPLAEGVECREEGETCNQLGFQYAQGFFYGRPRPVEHWLNGHSARATAAAV